jgi:acylphosphatase
MHPFYFDSVIIPTMQKTLHIIVSGRVQLVMYRDFTQRKARGIGLRGTVENLKDGTVEIYAQGEADAMETFIGKLHTGPVLARVERVHVEEVNSESIYEDFKILY